MEATSKALLRDKSLLFQDAPEIGAIACEGSDVRAWLNGLVTCDLVPRKIGEGAFGLAVSKTGKILAELYIALLAEDRFLVGARREAIAGLLEHFDRHLVMEDVAISDVSADHAWSFVHGDGARSLAAAVSDAGGRLVPMDFTGLGTCAVIAPPAKKDAAREAIATRAGDAIAWLSPEDLLAFRVERGVPRWGSEFDEGTYAQEAALERFGVSFTKGCYLGQEAVFMLQVRGHVKKRLVQLAIDGTPAIAPGAAIDLPDGTSVGAVTSVAPREGRTLALGHVKYKHAKPGEAFVVAGSKAIATDVVPPPKEG